MYFIRKKKHERDQRAGLIFHWRGFRKHHLGKFIALLVVSGFFAFSVYAIKIEGLKAPLLSKKEGVVIMLDVNDPGCRTLLLQVEERSPFPARWDPVTDREVMARVSGERERLEGALWEYQMNLEPMPEDKSSHGLASVTGAYDLWLEKASARWPQTIATGNLMARKDLLLAARVVADDALRARVAVERLALPVDFLADEAFGQVHRFQLGLDGQGFVITCIPLPGGTRDLTQVTDRQKKLAAWLRAQRFSPAQPGGDEMVVGQLELQIEVIRE